LAQPNFVDQNQDEVEIRIANESAFILKNIRLNTSSNEWTYGTTFKGAKTSYRRFDYAYPFFELYFEVNGKPFFYQPNSYNGYKKVSGGKYNALIYDVDTISLTFAFRLEEN
jgi:hypothetical protein